MTMTATHTEYLGATERVRMTKKEFTAILEDKYEQVSFEIHHENQYDGNPPVKMTLYYEESTRDGELSRHCGTWMGGECWEFPSNLIPPHRKHRVFDVAIAKEEDSGETVVTQTEESTSDGIDQDGETDNSGGIGLCPFEIIESIERGELDDRLDRLSDVIHARRNAVRAKAAEDMKASLSVGDKVVIARISPKYLVGAIATVVELPTRGKKVLVRLEETRRSWPMGTEAKVSASCLDPHDGGPTDSDLNPITEDSWKSYNYFIRIETVGNPDRNQYAPVTDPISLHSQTWDGLCHKIQEHINFYGIGGGNWTNPVLIREGKPVGIVSYNLRVWDTTDAFDLVDAKEILPTVNGI